MNLQKNYDLWQAKHRSEDWKKVKPLSSKQLYANIQKTANNPMNQTGHKTACLFIGNVERQGFQNYFPPRPPGRLMASGIWSISDSGCIISLLRDRR